MHRPLLHYIAIHCGMHCDVMWWCEGWTIGCSRSDWLPIKKCRIWGLAQTLHHPLTKTVFWTVPIKSNWLALKLHWTSISVILICKGHSKIPSLLVGDATLDILCCWEDFQAKIVELFVFVYSFYYYLLSTFYCPQSTQSPQLKNCSYYLHRLKDSVTLICTTHDTRLMIHRHWYLGGDTFFFNWETSDIFQKGGGLAMSKVQGKKNPAYGRQSITWPMRIVSPIQKNPHSKAKFAEKKTFLCMAILHPL